ncbi:hypothetical protein TSAR_006192 [Trichomalopsis sarcophagae]|uniref:Uncharacterized protein n=1 Tax=Trichomalopsis sarcophagae TaxID=543379 RepID=A0A232FB09_9HYME|nr:hypothetical protein TSAR_006192 [Trichomalopsis sarcophagae]
MLPIYLFNDDLEVGNAFGSHAGNLKFGALYASIACLPPRIASRLISIVLTLLVNSKDKKDVKDEDRFSKIVDELNFLREKGISIKDKNSLYTVKFQLVMILGDNLGLNGLFGFIESFLANYFCRICKALSDEACRITEEDETILRNRENYEADVKLGKSAYRYKIAMHFQQNFKLSYNRKFNCRYDA